MIILWNIAKLEDYLGHHVILMLQFYTLLQCFLTWCLFLNNYFLRQTICKHISNTYAKMFRNLKKNKNKFEALSLDRNGKYKTTPCVLTKFSTATSQSVRRDATVKMYRFPSSGLKKIRINSQNLLRYITERWHDLFQGIYS